MVKEDQETIGKKLKQITRDGGGEARGRGAKSNLFWKTRRNLMVKPKEEYDIITEGNTLFTDPVESNEYRVKY